MDSNIAAAVAGLTSAIVAMVSAGYLARGARNSTDRAEASYRRLLRADIGGVQIDLEEPTEEPARQSEAGEQPPEKAYPDLDAGPVLKVSPATTTPDPKLTLAKLPIDYHAQVLAQSRQSFALSLGAAIAGFLVIAIGVVLAFVGTVPTTVATMAGGVIAEAVAALFFTQSNKARSLMAGQLEGFRQSEETGRQAAERLTLINMVAEQQTKDELIAKTVLALAATHNQVDG